MVKNKPKQKTNIASVVEHKKYLKWFPALFLFLSILLCCQALSLLNELPGVLAKNPLPMDLVLIALTNLFLLFMPIFTVSYAFMVIRIADRHNIKISFLINAISVFLSYLIYIFLFAAGYLVVDYLSPDSFSGNLSQVDSLSISVGVSTTVGPPSIEFGSDVAKFLLVVQELFSFIYVVVLIGLLVSMMTVDRTNRRELELLSHKSVKTKQK